MREPLEIFVNGLIKEKQQSKKSCAQLPQPAQAAYSGEPVAAVVVGLQVHPNQPLAAVVTGSVVAAVPDIADIQVPNGPFSLSAAVNAGMFHLPTAAPSLLDAAAQVTNQFTAKPLDKLLAN